jgi:serine/threonine protein kinase
MSDNGSGSFGWQAPEILHNKNANSPEEKTKITKKVDIWSLGCLMFYVLSNSKHPFGDKYK